MRARASYSVPDPRRRSTALLSPNTMSLKPAEIAARALLAGPFTASCVAEALAQVRANGGQTRGVMKLAEALVSRFGEGKRVPRSRVEGFLAARADFRRWFREVVPAEEPPAEMHPVPGAPAGWPVPEICTLSALARWLGLDVEELHWLRAPWRGDHEKPAHHYRCRWIPRKGRMPRLIEAPLPRLKILQQRILRGILDVIPPHPAAHGFRRGRGIVSFAAPHTGQRCVLRMDIHHFFPSVRRARVLRVFLTAGYPESVAAALADLCTTVTPASVRYALPTDPGCMEEIIALRRTLQRRHLPQGAPTSPSLANLCAWSLDCRLAGLAAKFGATYTRYADDLLFSGDDSFRRDARRCAVHTAAVLLEEGFTAAHRKTRLMSSASSQRAAGLVLNAHPAIPRRERDTLRAILTNCVRHGPASQNRNSHPDFCAHLQGRIAQAAHVHPASAARLKRLFEGIEWNQEPSRK